MRECVDNYHRPRDEFTTGSPLDGLTWVHPHISPEDAKGLAFVRERLSKCRVGYPGDEILGYAAHESGLIRVVCLAGLDDDGQPIDRYPYWVVQLRSKPTRAAKKLMARLQERREMGREYLAEYRTGYLGRRKKRWAWLWRLLRWQ